MGKEVWKMKVSELLDIIEAYDINKNTQRTRKRM